MKQLIFLKATSIIILLMIVGNLTVNGQNLTAAQMNIYFGQPKKIVVTNQQGSITTEFDRKGRVVSFSQGPMRAVYDWDEDEKNITVSIYQGDDLQDSGHIEILELAPTKYSYTDGVNNTTILFNDNGAVEKEIRTNPDMTAIVTYYYKSDGDMYPYKTEMTMGEQSAIAIVSVDKFDDKGNAIELTLSLMGMNNVTYRTIEYY